MLSSFLALSRILTGVDSLDENLGRRYLGRLLATPYEPGVRRAIEVFERADVPTDLAGILRESLFGDDASRAAVVQIVLLWYTSALQENPASAPNQLRYGTPEEYFASIGWKIIGGHVPGVSGGYFGHWRYRPDNEPK